MDFESLFQHVPRDTEVTTVPFLETTDWLDDGNETSQNQFHQPVWQVFTTLMQLYNVRVTAGRTIRTYSKAFVKWSIKKF